MNNKITFNLPSFLIFEIRYLFFIRFVIISVYFRFEPRKLNFCLKRVKNYFKNLFLDKMDFIKTTKGIKRSFEIRNLLENESGNDIGNTRIVI